jgi:hypothetical protein
MAKLVIRTGPQMGEEFPSDQAGVQLGRGTGNDVILQDSQASRQHAEISEQGGQVLIRDLGSTNGTFVNEERVIGTRPLRPGDQIRIGDTILAYETGFAAAGPSTRPSAAATDWEAELWEDEEAAAPAAGRRGLLVWGLVGLVVVLLIGLAITAVVLLRKPASPTPVAGEGTAAPTSAIVVAPTATETVESEPQAPPTDTPLVDLPTVEPVDTVAVEPTVKAPAVKSPAVPTSVPLGPDALEQLPSIVAQAFPGVSPEALPEAMAQQIQSMSPEEVQAMIAALFPGVDPAQLPQVVAASFPELPQSEIEGLLELAFPGMTFDLPEVGPVGGRLVLGIHREGLEGRDLYLTNAMGGELALVAEQAQEPNFSPDGQWLVYYSWAPDRLGLRLIRPEGSDDTPLTTVKGDGYPSFSPDGQRVVFYNLDQNGIVLINRDGSGRREITKGEYPAWSPTGDQIVYRGCVGGGRCGLVVANADGSNRRQVTTHANDAAPRWSPNGGQIVFISDRDGNWEVYVINSDGSWLRRITNHRATDVMPVWSPDGLRIAFRSDRGGSGAVWVTSGIGGGATKLLDAPLGPTWFEDQMDWSE